MRKRAGSLPTLLHPRTFPTTTLTHRTPTPTHPAHPLHAQGDNSAAVDFYHKALGLRPDDSFAAEMLSEALEAECHAFASLSVDDGGEGGIDENSIGDELLPRGDVGAAMLA